MNRATLAGVLPALLAAAAAQGFRASMDQGRDPRAPFPHIMGLMQPVKSALANRALRPLGWLGLTLAMAQFSLNSYLVTYLSLERGWSIVSAGFALAVAQFSGVVGQVAWGWLADHGHGRVKLLRLGTALSVLGCAGLLNVYRKGNITLSNANNTISSVLTNATIGALSMKNNAALSVGAINATGDVTIANTAGLTLMTGQGIATTTGNIVLAGTKFINLAGANALTVANGKKWLVWSANPTSLNTVANGGDDNANLPNNFIQ